MYKSLIAIPVLLVGMGTTPSATRDCTSSVVELTPTFIPQEGNIISRRILANRSFIALAPIERVLTVQPVRRIIKVQPIRRILDNQPLRSRIRDGIQRRADRRADRRQRRQSRRG